MAARASRADQGFLHPRDLAKAYGYVCRVKYRKSSDAEIGQGFLSEKPLLVAYDDPIDSRGWTLQERFRSFRIVRFATTQTIWQCPTRRELDGGSRENIEDHPSRSEFSGHLADPPYKYHIHNVAQRHTLNWQLGSWLTRVNQYSKRSLSKRTDKLPGFGAMAEAFAKFLHLRPEDYLAGIWTFEIYSQLRWRRPEEWTGEGSSKDRLKPTWSWASVDGPVLFERLSPAVGETTLQIFEDECAIELKSRDVKYGEVEFGRLTVQGYMRPSRYLNEEFVGAHSTDTLPLRANWDNLGQTASEVWCLEMASWRRRTDDRLSIWSGGLLLNHAKDNEYQRLGYFDFDHASMATEPLNAGRGVEHRHINGRGVKDRYANSNWFYNGEFRKICLV